MSASIKCHHPAFHIEAEPEAVAGDPMVVLLVRLSCDYCGARFRFRGLPVGRSPTEATMSPDGFVAALPTMQIEAANDIRRPPD